MDLDDLIKSIDIVDYLSQFVDLEQRGDEFWGLSCFKDENTPSFSVRREEYHVRLRSGKYFFQELDISGKDDVV